VNQCWGRVLLLLAPCCLGPFTAQCQIDPFDRELIQVGYNAPLEGQAPIAAYAFYYRNVPDFLQHTNLTLRVALAPTYLESELGIRSILDQYTDLGIGVQGGGFDDNYYQYRNGTYNPNASFDGFGAETDVSLYHLFNPGMTIPLNGLLRAGVRYSTYTSTAQTYPDFKVPPPHGTFIVRAGFRWGGKEPVLFPPLAMEFSAWYEGQFRTPSGNYGFGDFTVEPQTHLFWGEALISYTLPRSRQNFFLSVSAGTSIDPDRFSAYRLGALLPLDAEYPLSIPGYYYQELSAQSFVLFSANYILPVEHRKRWNLVFTGASAWVDYLPGEEQPGNWNSGVGGGILYQSPAWKLMVGYGYGINAIRSSGRGANSIGILLQFDLGHVRQELQKSEGATPSHGLQRMLEILQM